MAYSYKRTSVSFGSIKSVLTAKIFLLDHNTAGFTFAVPVSNSTDEGATMPCANPHGTGGRDFRLAMEKRFEPIPWLTPGEAARLLHRSARTIRSMIYRKELSAFKVGNQWRIHINEVTKRIVE